MGAKSLIQEKRFPVASSWPRKPRIFSRTVAASRDTEKLVMTALISAMPFSLCGREGP